MEEQVKLVLYTILITGGAIGVIIIIYSIATAKAQINAASISGLVWLIVCIVVGIVLLSN